MCADCGTCMKKNWGVCVRSRGGVDARINIGPFRFVPPPKTQYVCEGSTICAGSLRFRCWNARDIRPAAWCIGVRIRFYRRHPFTYGKRTRRLSMQLPRGYDSLSYPPARSFRRLPHLPRTRRRKRRLTMNVRTIPLCCPIPDILILPTNGKKSYYKKPAFPYKCGESRFLHPVDYAAFHFRRRGV